MPEVEQTYLPVGKHDVEFFVLDGKAFSCLVNNPMVKFSDAITSAELMGYIVRADKVAHA